ncbi:tail protein [Aureimonas sp. SA4125]|uniref:baseplate J/gp47 family protein n=1 Tax=Aureimonas sp. SA4125 TaxID=2826993 RepID=UPI001CC6659C|nr:baseplate J/gp47 family protein [Aureimonas sp. SA4125]BDA84961.1 tail protein [Aureimonas sp. SA4125]
MAYQTRTLAEISTSIRGAFRQYLRGTDASIRQNVLYVIAKVLALLSREYELRFEWVYRQLFVATADDIGHIRMHAADYRIYQKAAAASVGAITGTGAAGGTYPAGIRFLSGGTSYLTSTGFVVDISGNYTASVLAEATGAVTNRDAGAVLILADPSLYPRLNDEALVAAGGLGGGADIEGIESLRARTLERKARPPQGGALPDYERFALEVPGVVAAWAYSFIGGIGTIAVYVLFAGRTNLIPTSGDVAAVQAAIDARRMIRADGVTVIAPAPVAVPVTISGLAVDTPAVRAAIEAGLRATFLARARPGISADPFILSRSWISEAISTATGEERHTLVAPEADVSFTGGQIPVLGTVTYV